LPGVSTSSAPHVARTAYEAFLAELRREPSATECEQWATNHAGDPDEPRALVDAGWSIARSGGDIEQALELFRRAAGFGGESGRDAQVGASRSSSTRCIVIRKPTRSSVPSARNWTTSLVVWAPCESSTT
jgi:hypothetical protein